MLHLYSTKSKLYTSDHTFYFLMFVYFKVQALIHVFDKDQKKKV